MSAKRPNPVLWLYYQYGGRLPDGYRDWVLHDATGKRWLLRSFVRTISQALPFVVLLLVLFGVFGVPWYFALACVVLGLVVSVYYALSYASDSVDSRLSRYGYPPHYASHFREERYEAEHSTETERYRDTGAPEGSGRGPDVPVAPHDPLRRRQLRQSHRTPGVQLLRGDADLGAHPELRAVGERGGGVDHHGGRVDPRGELPGRPHVLGDDRLGVAGRSGRDVRDRRVQRVDDGDGDVQRQVLGVPVGVGGRHDVATAAGPRSPRRRGR